MKKLTKKEIAGIGLPKWPGIVVAGKPVTTEQAAEIIIRTSSLWFCANDRAFEEELYNVLGIETDGGRFPSENGFATMERLKKDAGILPLEYLENRRILSAYIGGPHGWCNWNGEISLYNNNIGKYPDTETVLKELKIIAKAFPYLEMDVQLYSGEHCESGIRPVIEYRMRDGKVSAYIPVLTLRIPYEDPDIRMQREFAAILGDLNRERGCTIEYFKGAWEHTIKVMAHKEGK